MVKPPGFVECSGCGKEFGSRSMEIHEPLCVDKFSFDHELASDELSFAIEDEQPPSSIMEEDEEEENDFPNNSDIYYNSDWEDDVEDSDRSPENDPNHLQAVDDLSVTLSVSWPRYQKSTPRVFDDDNGDFAHRSLPNSLRPVTATLPRPTVLNIAYINKLDMSLTTSSELGRRSRKLVLPSIRRKKIQSLPKPFNEQNTIKDLSTEGSPSIRPHTMTIKGRTPHLNVPEINPIKEEKDEVAPCPTCSRSIYPERFHSHPPEGTKPANKPRIKQQRLPVTKAVPIKTLHNTLERRNMRRIRNSLLATTQKKAQKQRNRKEDFTKTRANEASDRGKTAVLKTTVNKASILLAPLRRAARKNKKLNKIKEESNKKDKIELPPEVGTAIPVVKGKRGSRPVVCYICGREYGSSSFPIHEPNCLEKWYRENDSLPAHLKRAAPPQRPATSANDSLTTKQWNALAWEHAQAQLVPCGNCGRTFFPERLEIHLKGCHPKEDSRPPPSAHSQKSSVSGKSFGHRRKLIVCYICGREFGSKSISFHEPSCLQKWKRENDQLPDNLKRKTPEKPEYVYTSTGKIDFDAMSDAMWQSHLQQLVPCENCGRTFYPDRLLVHQKGCGPQH